MVTKPNAPSSLRAAKKLYLRAPVRKYFPPCVEDEFEGGWFEGEVVKVQQNLPLMEGSAEVFEGLLFLIRYADGDREHVTFEGLQAILLNPNTPANFLTLSGVENQAGTMGLPPRASRGAGFSNITNQRKQLTLTTAPAPGGERRSRRQPKRKADDEYEYEDERTAKKRGAGAGGSAPGRLGAKFGLRAPSASAAPLAELSSESQEEVPTADSIRTVGLPGHLRRIELVNFMCHEHFTMEFGPHVTFVSGCNGSGKSAVLQGLQCCLGVKASQTGRAPSLKNFIRTGTDEAIVCVTLYNKPYKDFDAFQHELYGDLITVERRISRVGLSSAYFLKDQHGKIQARRREDLDALLHTLSINAANPVTVMTQDTARSFLAGSSTAADREKWSLYMDATQLSQIRYNLELSQVEVRLMDESVSKIKAEYEAIEAEQAALSKVIEALRGLEVWRCEIRQYEQVLAWTLVEDHAKSVAALESALGTLLPLRLAESGQRVEELEARRSALQQSADEKAQFLQTFTQRAQALSAEAESLKCQRAEAHKQVVGAKRKLDALERKLQEESGRKESLLAAVQETASSVAEEMQAVVAEYTRELEEADRAFKSVAAQVEAAAGAQAQADSGVQQAQEEEARVQRDLQAIHGQILRLQDSLQQLSQAKSSKVAKFGGRQMVELVRMINRQRGRFHRLPIGPLGQFLQLDSKWARAAEAAVNLSLNTFLVGDLHDCRLLQQLVRQAGFTSIKPRIAIVGFDIPAYSIPAQRQPAPHVPTLLRVLGCSHPQNAHTIINHLVDAVHIEKIALGETEEEGRRLGFDTPNVFACFGTDGSKYYRKGRSLGSLGPPNWMRTQAIRLGGDAVQQTQDLEQALHGLQQETAQLQQELAAAQQAVRAAQEALRAARIQSAGLQKERYHSKRRLDQLMTQVPPEVQATQAAAGGEGGEDEVQAEILEATQAVMDLEQQLGEKQREVADAERAEREAHDAFLGKKAEIDRLADENGQFVETWQADVQQLSQLEEELRVVAEQHDSLLKRQAHLEAQLATHSAALESLEKLAPKVCSREEAAAAKATLSAGMQEREALDQEKLERWFSVQIMQKKIERLRRKITEHERQAGGTLADLEVKFEAVQARMDSDGRRFRGAISIYNAMEAALQARFDKLGKLFRTVSESVNKRFNTYMARKGHLGSIKLDKENQTLQLKVQIGGKSGEGNRAVKDLKQLSGGERSFTTVAFTLALGAQTDMPFRVSDEFDVFMDAINRRIAMENLFGFAREHDALQFVFLSPQDVAAVEDARQGCTRLGMQLPEDFVKVVQMRPPRANAAHA